MLIDRGLVDRLERTASQLNALAAEALTAGGATDVAPPTPWSAGILIAMGPRRYVNRLGGLGTADVDVAAAPEIEDFFGERGVRPCIEVTPWASPTLLRLLAERGYAPAAFRDVFVQSPDGAGGAAASDSVTIEAVTADTLQRWLDVMAAAQGGLTGDARATSDEYCRARFAMPEGLNFIASIDGRPAGCGSLEITDGVAWLGGMATIPDVRNRGVQAALIRHRIGAAAAEGADVVASSAIPDNASARNLRRHGFDLAYSRVEAVR